MSYKFIKLNQKYINFILKLRNEKYVRKQSIRNNKVISLKDHIEWIKKIEKKNIFIIKSKNKEIGYIRLIKIYDFIFEISIAIIKDIRGKNKSFEILKSFHDKLNSNMILIANIKNDNVASRKIFEKCNYFHMKKYKNFSTYSKIIKSNSKVLKNLKIIKEIENVRNKNNLNWMDILRVAIETSPEKTSKIFNRISSSDTKILQLSKRIK
tara:strand:- start:177 stop:806 length:630 start_codon:yes stop_codon:yes gene_type:complete